MSYVDQDGPPYDRDDGTRWHRLQGGCAPARHPRRCHARSMVTGNRCAKWATSDSEYCPHHGGVRPVRNANTNRTQHDMGSKYNKHLKPSLAERLDDFLHSAPHAEQLQLYEEIAMSRVFLTETLAISTLLNERVDVDEAMKLLAMSQVRDAVSHVADLCSKMARIEKDLEDKVSVRQLGLFVEELTRVIYRRLGKDSDVALELAQDLRSRVKMPENPEMDPMITVEFESE